MTDRDGAAGIAIATRLREEIARMTTTPRVSPIGIDPAQILDPPAFHAATQAMGIGELEAAGEIAADLLARYPGHPEAAYTLAMVAYWQYDAATQAIAMLEEVVQSRPAFALAWYNLGFLRQRTGDDAGCVTAYERALAHDGTLVGAHVNLGNAKLGAGDVAGALACYADATKYETADSLAIYNRAIAHLLTGQHAKGWADYEARLATPLFRAKAKLPPYPLWDGSAPSAGARLLVWAEQGYGDTLMAARYFPRLGVAFDGRVTVAVQPALVDLLRLSYPDTVSYAGPLPEADLVVPTMSLPHRLGHPTHGAPYLLPRAHATRPATPRVGYVWAGDPKHEADARRSTTPEQWAGILATPGLEFVSLQVGRGGTYQPADFLETAEDVARLDLVLTVDTAVAHLAGAMGVPVWILIPAMPDYRWGLGSDRTVWYDSARLYRQAKIGEWGPVFARVQADLEAWREGR